MYVNKLQEIVQSINKPIDKYTKERWDEIEIELGIKLPTDYKDFINQYGVANINDFLWILNPFTQNPNLNLIKKGKEIRQAYTILKDEFPGYFIHDVFPSNNGLLPCAITDNGDEIYWLTSETIDEWSIIVYESRSSQYYEYKMGIVQFIYELIYRDLICLAFPEDFIGD